MPPRVAHRLGAGAEADRPAAGRRWPSCPGSPCRTARPSSGPRGGRGPTGRSWPPGTTPPRRVGPGAAPRGRGAGARAADHQRQAAARLLRDGILPAGRLPAAGPLVRRGGRRGVRTGSTRRRSAPIRPGTCCSARRSPIRGSGPTTSWWDSDPVPIPVSLRERGDRAMRGRRSRVPDPTADRLRLTAEAAAGGRAAPGGRGRAGADRLAARRDHLPGRAGPAAGPGGRAAGPAPRRDRRPRRRPAAARGPRPGHGRHQPGRDHRRSSASASRCPARARLGAGRDAATGRRGAVTPAPRVSTAGLDAGERRIAARHLLSPPILTAARQPAELDLVRRHATALKSMFASQLGYALIVESSVRPPGEGAAAGLRAVRPARRATDDSPFTAGTYVHLVPGLRRAARAGSRRADPHLRAGRPDPGRRRRAVDHDHRRHQRPAPAGDRAQAAGGLGRGQPRRTARWPPGASAARTRRCSASTGRC